MRCEAIRSDAKQCAAGGTTKDDRNIVDLAPLPLLQIAPYCLSNQLTIWVCGSNQFTPWDAKDRQLTATNLTLFQVMRRTGVNFQRIFTCDSFVRLYTGNRHLTTVAHLSLWQSYFFACSFLNGENFQHIKWQKNAVIRIEVLLEYELI